MKKIIHLLLLAIALCTAAPASAQKISMLANRINRFNYLFPQEKVYVHLDNTGYFIGETIWLKAYVVRADVHVMTNLSRVLYVDLVSPMGEVEQTLKLPIRYGMAEGSFSLEGLLSSGFYEVRAYTRYMTNWGDENVFSRVIPIFKQPEKAGDYSNTIIDKTDHRKLLPDYREQAEKRRLKGGVSVGFYPEGGHLLKGAPCRVAFEVLDEQGQGFATQGELRQGTTVVGTVSTADNGRGLFTVTPAEAPLLLVLKDLKGHERSFELPAAEASGVAIQVDAVKGDDVAVTIHPSADLQGDSIGVAIMGRGKMKVCHALCATGESVATTFTRQQADNGVNHVFVFDDEGRILADRLFFKYPTDTINAITFKAGDERLVPGQKMTIEAQSRPKSWFSLAIRDYDMEVNGPQQRVDTWLLLSSDLKGYIANAEYYLEADDETHRRATDLLMMVQGWHRYSPRQMMNDERLEKNEPIEDRLFLFGFLHNKRKKSAPFSDVQLKATLYNGYGNVLRGETMSDSTGHFAFALPDCEGEWRMEIKTLRDGKPQNYNVGMNRQPTLKPRLISGAEQQRLPLGNPAEEVQPIDGFDNLMSLELRNYVLEGVTVTGHHYMSSWEDESVGQRSAGIRYDCQKEIDAYMDKGKPLPNLFVWLQERNEYFEGDSYNVFDMDNAINSENERKTLFPDDGWTYNHRPIVWILNNDFYAVTMYPNTGGAGEPELMRHASILDMPDDLEDIKSVYISDDDKVWQKFIQWPHLNGRHPVTIFVYSDNYTSKHQKGVRKTYFDGYSVDTYDMPGYMPLPPAEDHRRTLYWNPTVVTDAEGKAKIEFFNSNTCKRISISAEGITPKGNVLVYKP